MTKQEVRHMHKLLDAMLNRSDVWVLHLTDEWQMTKIVNITRAGSVSIANSGRSGFLAFAAKDVHLKRPELVEHN